MVLCSALLQDKAGNPEYKGWTSFNPGSSVPGDVTPLQAEGPVHEARQAWKGLWDSLLP